MAKTLRPRTKIERRKGSIVAPPRRSVTRREYAELAVRLGSAELQMQRNRAAIDLQARRIAQLEELVAALHASAGTHARATELPSLPPVTTPTVES